MCMCVDHSSSTVDARKMKEYEKQRRKHEVHVNTCISVTYFFINTSRNYTLEQIFRILLINVSCDFV